MWLLWSTFSLISNKFYKQCFLKPSHHKSTRKTIFQYFKDKGLTKMYTLVRQEKQKPLLVKEVFNTSHCKLDYFYIS